MRVVWVLVVCTLGTTACSHSTGSRRELASGAAGAGSLAPGGTAPGSSLIVTPETGLAGKVALVNREDRFVVLNFPVGHLPALEQKLNVYHLGLKVGEVTVTGPQRDDNIVGNLTAGEAKVGDVVRDR